MSLVLVEKKDNVAVLSINRPDALNALNIDLLNAIDEKITELEKDDDVYVIVLTGIGKAFVAGADIAYMKDLTAIEAAKFSKFGNEIFLKIEQMEKPVIAAVNGFALGGGCELAMACDIRIASVKAKFGQPEVSLGITPGFAGTQRLARIVGSAKAKELIFTADVISAEEAKAIGLVNAVYDIDDFLEKALEMAKKIASNAQIAVRQSKKAINAGMQTDINTAIAYEVEAFGLCFSTEDQKDAMNAFISKEKIVKFKNK